MLEDFSIQFATSHLESVISSTQTVLATFVLYELNLDQWVFPVCVNQTTD